MHDRFHAPSASTPVDLQILSSSDVFMSLFEVGYHALRPTQAGDCRLMYVPRGLTHRRATTAVLDGLVAGLAAAAAFFLALARAVRCRPWSVV